MTGGRRTDDEYRLHSLRARAEDSWRAYVEAIGNAWKNPPPACVEFGNTLYVAYVAGELTLLREYVAAGKPIPQGLVSVAGSTIPLHVLVADLLGGRPHQQVAGRPHRVAGKAPAIEKAERNAAWLVAFAKTDWLERNARKRVPSDVTNRMIKAAVKEAAKTFKVPVSAISESNIRNVLKNRRVVVR